MVQSLDLLGHPVTEDAAMNREQVDERLPLRSFEVYELVRLEGEEELERPTLSLFSSGVAAGLAMGASVTGYALLRDPEGAADASRLIAPLGYTVGFLIVILGRLQLFTENTITAILPLLNSPNRRVLGRTARLWALVLGANLIGTALFALFCVELEMLGPKTTEMLVAASNHVIHQEGSTLLRGVPAGFLVAAIVWMLPSARGSEVLVIVGLTYLISLGGFSHVIAGSIEVFIAVLSGSAELWWAVFGYILPALIGNILGGTCLFSLLAYAQVASELDDSAS